jgi:hypothetical protein
MASLADTLYRTDVFAPQNQRVITNSTTTQWADVFARRERRETTVTVPRLRRLPVRLSIDGEPVELTYTTPNADLPRWAGPVLQSLSERWGSQVGWDSYQAEPTNPQLVVKLLNILSDLMRENSVPPQVTPLADGGVQAEWHHQEQDLEIVISAAEDPAYYYFNRGTGAEEEAFLNPHYAHVQDLIGQI